MTEEELIERTRTIIQKWDNIRIVGQGWAGDTRRGFQFNPIRTSTGTGITPVTPSGACCPEEGDCFITTQSICEAGGGTYQGDDTTCDPDPCPPPTPTGACCVGTDCTIETESDCTGMGGTYQGDDTTCDPNPCEVTPCPCGGIAGFLGIGNYLVSTFHQTRTSHAVATPFVDECDLTLDISTITTVDPVTCVGTVTCSGTFTYHSDTAGDCSASWVSNGMGGCIQNPSCNNCLGGACESCALIIDSDTHESCTCSYSDVAGNTAEYMAETTLSNQCTP